jgi:photosystem II stability/assembly factor-like uncharacterized protein
LLSTVTCVGCGRSTPALSPSLVQQVSGTVERLQAVSAVDEQVVWASGVGGSFARTTDGGEHWSIGMVPGADSLQFRDVHAVSAEVAYLLSAGPGALSRIYKTTDGGTSWRLQFTNSEPEGFFDCFDFWDPQSGVAFSDAVEGQFIIVRTVDGEIWERVPQEHVPPALPGEGSFAASGTCLVTRGDSTAWIGTGAAAVARVLKTTNRGRTWTVSATPLVAGEAAGIASVAFRDLRHGVAAGGDIGSPDAFTDNVVVTADGGESWILAGRPTFAGAIYGAAWVPGAPMPTLVVVGPAGADYSVDGGETWQALDSLDYWGIGFAASSAGWISGPEGRIARVRLYR